MANTLDNDFDIDKLFTNPPASATTNSGSNADGTATPNERLANNVAISALDNVADFANSLMSNLERDVVIELPQINSDVFKLPPGLTEALQKNQTPILNTDLTERKVTGKGIVDDLMNMVHNHLEKEYNGDRITGETYGVAYSTAIQYALSTGVQFLLSKDQAYWQAISAQLQAAQSQVEFEKAKFQLITAQIQAKAEAANYAMTKMKLAQGALEFATAKFNLQVMLPKQLEKANQDLDLGKVQIDLGILDKTAKGINIDTAKFNLDKILHILLS